MLPDAPCLQANVSVNFIFLIIGLLVSSVVPPLAFMLTWPAVPRGAAIASALGGQAQDSCCPVMSHGFFI